MAPEHKFATAARLCSEVLSGFAEGTLPLDAAAEVLRDALHILASKDIKVRCLFLSPHQEPALLHQTDFLPCCIIRPPSSYSPRKASFSRQQPARLGPKCDLAAASHLHAWSILLVYSVLLSTVNSVQRDSGMRGKLRANSSMKGWRADCMQEFIFNHNDAAAQVASARGAAAAAEEEEASAQAAEGAAKGRLVSAMMKKYLAEGMVPVLLELKRCLEATRHPLLGDLLAAFRALLRDHKNEARPLQTPPFV